MLSTEKSGSVVAKISFPWGIQVKWSLTDHINGVNHHKLPGFQYMSAVSPFDLHFSYLTKPSPLNFKILYSQVINMLSNKRQGTNDK